MINKGDIIAFFNKKAETWDQYNVVNESIVNDILNNTHVEKDKTILDVACGTGVLIPYYKSRNVKSIKAIDISNKMIEKAKTKFNDENIEFICTDAQYYNPNEKFDCIIIYNAFPHFVNQIALIENMCSLLKDNGYLSIAHGLSETELNRAHSGKEHICMPLLSYKQLINICPNTIQLKQYISNDRMYQVVWQRIN